MFIFIRQVAGTKSAIGTGSGSGNYDGPMQKTHQVTDSVGVNVHKPSDEDQSCRKHGSRQGADFLPSVVANDERRNDPSLEQVNINAVRSSLVDMQRAGQRRASHQPDQDSEYMCLFIDDNIRCLSLVLCSHIRVF